MNLKPCPFCGTPPLVSTRRDEDLATHNEVEWTSVGCPECSISFEWPTHGYHDQNQDPSIPLAVYQWQRREPVAAATE